VLALEGFTKGLFPYSSGFLNKFLKESLFKHLGGPRGILQVGQGISRSGPGYFLWGQSAWLKVVNGLREIFSGRLLEERSTLWSWGGGQQTPSWGLKLGANFSVGNILDACVGCNPL